MLGYMRVGIYSFMIKPAYGGGKFQHLFFPNIYSIHQIANTEAARRFPKGDRKAARQAPSFGRARRRETPTSKATTLNRRRPRRNPEGDRKAARRAPSSGRLRRGETLCWKPSKNKKAANSDCKRWHPPKSGHAARLSRAAPPKYASTGREVQRGRRPLWQESRGQRPLVGCRGEAPARRRRNPRGVPRGLCPLGPVVKFNISITKLLKIWLTQGGDWITIGLD